MKLSTSLPDGLATRIRDCIADSRRQAEKSEKANAALNAQISAMEATQAEVEDAVESLKKQAHTSDDSTSQLLVAERRALAINLELNALRSTRDKVVGLDLLPSLIVLDDVVHFYRDAVKNEMVQAVAPFGIPEHLALPLMAHCAAFQILNVIQNWVSTVPPSDLQTARRINKYFSRALAGQVRLDRDTPTTQPQSPATQEGPVNLFEQSPV